MFNIDGYAEAVKAGKIIVIDSRGYRRRLTQKLGISRVFSCRI